MVHSYFFRFKPSYADNADKSMLPKNILKTITHVKLYKFRHHVLEVLLNLLIIFLICRLHSSVLSLNSVMISISSSNSDHFMIAYPLLNELPVIDWRIDQSRSLWMELRNWGYNMPFVYVLPFFLSISTAFFASALCHFV